MDLLRFAKSIAERAEAAALDVKVPVTVCVIDAHGNVVLKHCMPGALGASSDLAERKAYTAVMTRMRTLDLVALVQPGQPLSGLVGVSGGRYCAMGGGVPLTREGEVIAGVGVSGGSVDQDVAIVEAASRQA
jgi:uncharacterized protein GlcG (DUF336 family)